jgi:hypothetical protein
MIRINDGLLFESTGRVIDISNPRLATLSLSCDEQEEGKVIQYGFDGKAEFFNEATQQLDRNITDEEKKEVAAFMVEEWAAYGGLEGPEGQSTFNINNHVYVKLNDAGFLHWQAKFNEPFTGEYAEHIQELEFFTKRADKDGYVQFQMWEFMKWFGDEVRLADLKLFDVNIRFDKKDLK